MSRSWVKKAGGSKTERRIELIEQQAQEPRRQEERERKRREMARRLARLRRLNARLERQRARRLRRENGEDLGDEEEFGRFIGIGTGDWFGGS